MKLLIRKMKKEDMSKVTKIATESWHGTYDGIIPRIIQDNFLSQAYNSKMLEIRYLQTPFYVAELNGEIVGFANYSNINNDRSIELSAIYLHPCYKNMGIGSELLYKGIQELKAELIYVNVETANGIGITFYNAKGFQIVDEFDDDFDGHILKTTRMVLKI
ncbi:GNAT family N-acetyltransferase [Lysinibacillus sphaericus]|uniref:GNAT family acetyltransferase n=1 Tax=Lysinibacillus sphaericus OT4b.31 TaxID=1285586 RepID=R7Z8H5_LYSSH|nr:GNAT family N-acetyltransferase [Lysinibacillus sphaericus]EON70241.1 GNAT family acetyltransferase [Lysinibacillus sphaericus OT4b.31]